MFKKCKAILLTSNNRNNATIQQFGNQLRTGHYKLEGLAYWKHLYIISDDEIKEGDWFINTTTSTIHQCHSVSENIQSGLNGKYYHGKFECKKVIATTDTSLGLPKPSDSFIAKYVEAFNKNKTITDVLVEFEYALGNEEDENMNLIPDLFIKLDRSNTITIKKIKDTFSTGYKIMNLLNKNY